MGCVYRALLRNHIWPGCYMSIEACRQSGQSLRYGCPARKSVEDRGAIDAPSYRLRSHHLSCFEPQVAHESEVGGRFSWNRKI
jgi:hypothetical protein